MTEEQLARLKGAVADALVASEKLYDQIQVTDSRKGFANTVRGYLVRVQGIIMEIENEK